MRVLPTTAFGTLVRPVMGKGVVIVKVVELFRCDRVDVGDQSVRRSSHERVL